MGIPEKSFCGDDIAYAQVLKIIFLADFEDALACQVVSFYPMHHKGIALVLGNCMAKSFNYTSNSPQISRCTK